MLSTVLGEGSILSLMSLGAMSFCLHGELSYLEQPCESLLIAEASLRKVLKPWLHPEAGVFGASLAINGSFGCPWTKPVLYVLVHGGLL